MNSSGTGFFITNSIIITNYHVVGEESNIKIELFDDSLCSTKIIAKDKKRDLAALKTSSCKSNPLKIYQGKQLKTKLEVMVIGNPDGGMKNSITKGIISRIGPFDEGYQYIQTDASINHGNSGGPLLYNDKVIGVVTYTTDKALIEGIGYALHYEELNEFIKQNNL